MIKNLIRSTFSRRSLARHNGCGFLFVVCFFSCLFLLINGTIVAGFAPRLIAIGTSFENRWLRWLNGPRLAQIVVFALPVIMVFVEWAIVDWIVDRIAWFERSSNRDEKK